MADRIRCERMSVRESVVRDHFAARYAHPQIEVRTTFGRIDVVADGFAIEVEPFGRWKHGVRQAFAYAKETGLSPAIAIYGDMTPEEATRIYRLCAGKVTVFLLSSRRWFRISSFDQADRRWFAPPDDLRAVKRPDRQPDPDRDRLAREMAAAMDRAMTA